MSIRRESRETIRSMRVALDTNRYTDLSRGDEFVVNQVASRR